uniref:DDE Tnp4 domain-containing protein n=1 Tax=Paramormyrops kingsleyae TaxID=1676925 RepID=A0A3B3TB02_9TELE
MDRTQFGYLLTKLQENGLSREHSHGKTKYMANQNSFRELSDKFNLSVSSAHRTVLQVLTILSRIGPTFISWPNGCEKGASAAAFQRTCGLAGVIGAIDGCHIQIQKPAIRGVDYMNRKGFCSVLLQGIVDEKGRFIDIFAGPPGRVHDARMLRASDFFLEWHQKMGEYFLLGDSAYISQAFPFICAPKRDNGRLTEAEHQLNARISRGRVIVEQAFGCLKCKWRRLRDLQNTRTDIVVMVIMAACFLHNMRYGLQDGDRNWRTMMTGLKTLQDGNWKGTRKGVQDWRVMR